MKNSGRVGLMVRRWICWAIACFWLVGCQAVTLPENAIVQVGRVISGQELETIGLPNQPEITERLTLAGIAVPAPSLKPWGEAAKTKLEELTAHQSLRLETENTAQSQGRSVYLWRGEQLLNELLVAEGYAIVLPNLKVEKYAQRLNYAQDRARVLGLGVWNPVNPLRQLSPAAPDPTDRESGRSQS